MYSRQAAAEQDLREKLSGHIEYLASDELQGRFPGTEGGKKAIAYQIEKLKEYGFEPGYVGEFTQPVTLAKTTVTDVVLNVFSGGEPRLVSGEGVQLLGTLPDRALSGEALVAVAPEIGAIPESVAGKYLLLFNPPPSSDLFRKARETNAAGLVIIVDDSERMKRVRRAANRSNYTLGFPSSEGMPLLYISGEAAEAVFAGEETTRAIALAEAARADGLFELPFTLDFTFSVTQDTVHTANVIGKLPGTKPGSGAVMLLAHWDHTGLCRPEGTADRICNGAADNASGIAAMLEAGRIIAEGPPLDRDVYLMGNTAEELGLLGATAFAINPPIPAEQFVATFSMDTLAIAGPDAPLTIVGYGTTPLDNGIKTVGKRLGRTFDIKDSHQQFTRRHDGAALMAVGIPSVVVGSAFGDQEKMDAFFASRYHQPSDEFDEGFEMGGMLADMPLYVELLRYFGDTRQYMPPEDSAK